MAGTLYVFFYGVGSILKNSFEALNNFKVNFYSELIFQIVRLVIISFVVLFALKMGYNDETLLFYMIVGLSVCYFIYFLFFIVNRSKLSFLAYEAKSLDVKEKKQLNYFLIMMSATAFSGVFFSYVDRIMLGRFVGAEFIGYYAAAFSLVGSAIPLIALSGAFLPVFSRMQKKELKIFFKKSSKIILMTSVLAFLFFFLFSKYLVLIVFGENYMSSVGIMKSLSLLLIIVPITSLISTYIISMGKPVIVTKALLTSTLANIMLNYILILILIGWGEIYAVYGVVVATIISNMIYLAILTVYSRKIS